MKIIRLRQIREKLWELYTSWYMAQRTNDKRRIPKANREACAAISAYAETLPPEVLGLFDSKVAPAALNSQFAGEDILPCIQILDEKIKELEDKKDKYDE